MQKASPQRWRHHHCVLVPPSPHPDGMRQLEIRIRVSVEYNFNFHLLCLLSNSLLLGTSCCFWSFGFTLLLLHFPENNNVLSKDLGVGVVTCRLSSRVQSRTPCCSPAWAIHISTSVSLPGKSVVFMNHFFVNCHYTWHCMHVAVTEEVGTLPPLILKSRNLCFGQIKVNFSKSCR